VINKYDTYCIYCGSSDWDPTDNECAKCGQYSRVMELEAIIFALKQSNQAMSAQLHRERKTAT
jgi:ribosomal protein L37E